MSALALAAAMIDMRGTPTERLLLIMIAREADDAGRTSVAQSVLADLVGVDVSTVTRNLASIEAAGLIRRVPRAAVSGGRLPDNIELTIPPFSCNLPGGLSGKLRDQESRGVDIPISSETRAPGPVGLKPLVTPEIRTAAAAIWEGVPDGARKGSAVAKVEFALRDARLSEADLAETVAGVLAYYAAPEQQRDGGRFAGAPQRVIESRKWATGRPPPPPPGPAATEVEWQGRFYPVPPGGQAHPVGTAAQPGVARQLSLLREWFSRPPGLREAHWREHEFGPMPGAPGCRCWEYLIDLVQKERANDH